jgi:hypothetical protein
MPAPQADFLKQMARTKFMSFALKVPTNWQQPSGDPAAKHYGMAFKDSEKSVPPGAPPLFLPATPNKYHVDAQKMHIGKVGAFMDGINAAIAGAWGQWQTMASMVGFIVAGPVVSLGQIVGPPFGPLILANGAPMSSPMEMKWTNAIANAINVGWLAFTASVKSPGLPFYPAYAAVPTPVAPPMPNLPVPFAMLTQVPTPISTDALKGLMIANLADPTAPFNKELFESVAFAFEQAYNIWKISTMVTNVMAIATGGTPITPIPAVGTATMIPGGFT